MKKHESLQKNLNGATFFFPIKNKFDSELNNRIVNKLKNIRSKIDSFSLKYFNNMFVFKNRVPDMTVHPPRK